MKKIMNMLTMALLCPVILSAAIINVPGDVESIQQAIDMASTGDTVLVAPGTYYENIRFMGKNITVASHFIQEEDPSYILSTVIDGSQPEYADTASCVMFIHGEDSTAVLAGFTLTGGTGTVWEDEHYLNHWYTEGGGVLVQYSSPTIRNNIIINNQATATPTGVTSAGGGAIRSGDSNPHILNNIIMNNQGRYGAGIVLNYSGAVIRNNIIAGNAGGEDYGGGGIWSLGNGAEPKIVENNTIVNNHSTTYGGGIRLWSTTMYIANCIIWGNTANSVPQIQGSTGMVSYSNIEGGYSGTNNIDSDPMFDGEMFVLDGSSPCVDAGNPGPEFNDPEDPQNTGMAIYPSMGSLTNDIGAYGGPGAAIFPDLLTSVRKLYGNTEKVSVKIFPNPVLNGRIFLKVADINDHLVYCNVINQVGAVIMEKDLRNEMVCTFDLGNLDRGMYFLHYRLNSGVTGVEKVILQ